MCYCVLNSVVLNVSLYITRLFILVLGGYMVLLLVVLRFDVPAVLLICFDCIVMDVYGLAVIASL